MSKLLPLLSDGLVEILKSIKESTDSKIASELLEAHYAILTYNCGFFWVPNDIDTSFVKNTLLKRIDELITDEVRALSIRRDVFEISYTPKGKELQYSSEGTWSRENRQTGKPGRIIKKLMKFDYKEKDIEIFNNLLKANMVCIGNFEVVSGPDITKYYNADTYYKCTSTLGNSCMRYAECADYFQIYEDHAKMLVCLKNGCVMGRAIIWEIDGKTFMDRVYVCEDYLESQFIEYAKDHGWYRRPSNSLLSNGDSQDWIDSNGCVFDSYLTIKLKQKYECLPYMDSFRYYDVSSNSISTCCEFGDITLDSTDGNYEGHPWACECCSDVYYSYDEDETPDELCWSEYEECYLCERCRTYCSGINDYVYSYRDIVRVNLNSRFTETYPSDYICDNTITTTDVSMIGDDDAFIKINDEWYRADHPGLEVIENKIILK